MTGKNIKLVIGLGNPGKEYQDTYHNAGFLFIDYLNDLGDSRFGVPSSKLVKSTAFVNQSGDFARKTIKKHGARPEELLLVHDDSDIEIGKFKISFGRSSAGHKGVDSVIQAIGTKNFWRLRIGIRPKTSATIKRGAGLPAVTRRPKAGEFVLKKISRQDKETLRLVCEKIMEAIF